MPVEKVSITLEAQDLKWVKGEARRKRTSVSAVLADAVAQSRARGEQARYLKAAGEVDESSLLQALRDLTE